jgi:hypothetical protein
MKTNLCLTAARLLCALMAAHCSTTFAAAQFSTAMPVPARDCDVPATAVALFNLNSLGMLPIPKAKAQDWHSERVVWLGWPHALDDADAVGATLPSAEELQHLHAVQSAAGELQLTGLTILPLRAPKSSPVITDADRRFAESAGTSPPPLRKAIWARSSSSNALPQIRLQPIGVIPPTDGK